MAWAPDIAYDPAMNPEAGERYLAIVNPAAGAGRCGKRAPAAVERLRSGGLEVEVRRTAGPRDATRIGREGFAEGYRSFIVAGGDGSACEVVNCIVPPALQAGEKVRLGFLPLGTGNAFLRSFATDRVGYSIESLLAGRRRPCDVLVLRHREGEHYMINLFGFGMSVQTSIRSIKHKRWGVFGFVIAAVESMIVAPTAPLPLRLDGGELLDGPVGMICISNSQYAAQMLMAPDADIADGLLDLIRVEPIGRLEMMRTFPKLLKGTHLEHPRISAAQGREIVFEVDEEVDVMADGEVMRVLPWKIDVLQEVLEVCL